MRSAPDGYTAPVSVVVWKLCPAIVTGPSGGRLAGSGPPIVAPSRWVRAEQHHLRAGDLVDDLQVAVVGLRGEHERGRGAGDRAARGRDRHARSRLCQQASAAQDLDAGDLAERQFPQRGPGGGGVAAIDGACEGGGVLQAVHRLRDDRAGRGLVVDAPGDRPQRVGDHGGAFPRGARGGGVRGGGTVGGGRRTEPASSPSAVMVASRRVPRRPRCLGLRPGRTGRSATRVTPRS